MLTELQKPARVYSHEEAERIRRHDRAVLRLLLALCDEETYADGDGDRERGEVD